MSGAFIIYNECLFLKSCDRFSFNSFEVVVSETDNKILMMVMIKKPLGILAPVN